LAASGVAGNCAAAPGGAGLDALTLRLRNTAGACVPATFAIAAGAALPASTYADDCGTPTPAACVDADQDIAVAGIASGRYRLSAEGFVDGTACWVTSPTVRVPAAAAEAMLGTLNLVRSSAAQCAAP
jgi:hypothetical protein